MGATSRSIGWVERSPARPRVSLLSPLGALIAEIHEEAGRAGSVSSGMGARPRAASPARPGVDLRLETRVVSDPVATGSLSGRWLWPASVALHAGLILAAVVGPLLVSPPLPEPEHAVRAFLVSPALAPPMASVAAPLRASETPRRAANAQPPRPVPARAKTPSGRADRAVPLTAPVAAPVRAPVAAAAPALPAGDGLPSTALADIVPEPGEGSGAGGDALAAGGAPGGVAGGGPGAGADVVGDRPAGVPAPAPTATPTPRRAGGPVRVGGEITEPKKLKHVAPVYPDIALRANVRGTVHLDCTVSPEGRVIAVKIVRGVPLLTEAAVAAVKQWIYSPTLRDGTPVTVLLAVTVQFDLDDRRRSSL